MTSIINEEWRAIPNYEGIYSISNLGNIRTEERQLWNGKVWHKHSAKILKQTPDRHGYLGFVARKNGVGKRIQTHQAIAFAFIGNRPKNQEVRHLDGNKINNSAENIAYGTRSQNIKDAKAHGTFAILENRPCAILTREQAIEIATSREEANVLATRYGVKRGTIYQIWSGITWREVTDGLRDSSYRKHGMRIPTAVLTDKQVLEIWNSSEGYKSLASKYGVGKGTVYSIKSGRTWKHITGFKVTRLD